VVAHDGFEQCCRLLRQGRVGVDPERRRSRASCSAVEQAEVADRADGLQLDDAQQVFEVEVARFH